MQFDYPQLLNCHEAVGLSFAILSDNCHQGPYLKVSDGHDHPFSSSFATVKESKRCREKTMGRKAIKAGCRLTLIEAAKSVTEANIFFSIKSKNDYNSTVPIIAEKDTRSSSFHYVWHLKYKLALINK